MHIQSSLYNLSGNYTHVLEAIAKHFRWYWDATLRRHVTGNYQFNPPHFKVTTFAVCHQKWWTEIKVTHFSASEKFRALPFMKDRTTLDTLASETLWKKTAVSEVRSLKHGLSTAGLQAGRKITRTDRLADRKHYCPPLYRSTPH